MGITPITHNTNTVHLRPFAYTPIFQSFLANASLLEPHQHRDFFYKSLSQKSRQPTVSTELHESPQDQLKGMPVKVGKERTSPNSSIDL